LVVFRFSISWALKYNFFIFFKNAKKN